MKHIKPFNPIFESNSDSFKSDFMKLEDSIGILDIKEELEYLMENIFDDLNLEFEIFTIFVEMLYKNKQNRKRRLNYLSLKDLVDHKWGYGANSTNRKELEKFIYDLLPLSTGIFLEFDIRSNRNGIKFSDLRKLDSTLLDKYLSDSNFDIEKIIFNYENFYSSGKSFTDIFYEMSQDYNKDEIKSFDDSMGQVIIKLKYKVDTKQHQKSIDYSGISPDVSNDIKEYVNKYSLNIRQGQELIDIFKKHLNK
jgi:hypothetical protein